MQIASSKIWTQVTVSVSYEDNYYTTSAYIRIYVCVHVVYASVYAPILMFLGSEIVVSEFELQTYCYFHFRA